MSAPLVSGQQPPTLERRVRRVLAVGTWSGIALIAAGVVLMLGAGISPLSETFPVFDPGTVVPDLLALRPEGFLWAGIVVFIATPVVRVAGELVVYVRGREWTMTWIATAILAILALSVVLGLIVEL